MLENKIKWALSHFKALIANSVMPSTADVVSTLEKVAQERAFLIGELQTVKRLLESGGTYSVRLALIARVNTTLEKVLG
jgi:hypothetical protein